MSRCGDCKYFYTPPDWRSATGICEYFIKTNTITPQWIISQKFEVMDFAGLDCKAFEDKLDTPEFPPKSNSMALSALSPVATGVSISDDKEHRLWERVVKTERRLEVLENDLEALRGLVIPVR